MEWEIVSKLAAFRQKILYENRFFVSEDPFLVEFQKIIEADIIREEPVMVSELTKGNVLYRARIMDRELADKKDYIAKWMQQYCVDLSMIEKCKICKENEKNGGKCKRASTDKSIEEWKRDAKEQLQGCAISKEHNFKGFGKTGSSLLPKEKCDMVSDMRANPKYIRYLYAASDKYTALLEARSNINSIVSVANIELLEPLRILDITNLGSETDSGELTLLLYQLNESFSTPVTGELKDYLLSQVISEYIKCLDCVPRFDGICFRSSLNPKGKNYTIFSEEKYLPVSSEVYYVNEIGLTAYSITDEKITKIDASNTNM